MWEKSKKSAELNDNDREQLQIMHPLCTQKVATAGQSPFYQIFKIKVILCGIGYVR